MAHGLPLKSELKPQEDEEYMLGIDEAGRGPILGPMTYGAAWFPLKNKEAFSGLGFKDSKKLSADNRERLFSSIRECKKVEISFNVIVITALEISQQMLKLTKVNLNEISHNAAIDLIRNALALGFKLKEVYVDTVGNKTTYQRKLKRLFPALKITVSEKADDKYPVVSAASICAKVLRDKIMEHFEFIEEDFEDRDFGSGYLADQKTVNWVVRNCDKVFAFPTLVRFSWKPSQVAMKQSAVKVKWCKYGDDDDDEIDANQVRLNFPTRFRYFTENEMDIVYDF